MPDPKVTVFTLFLFIVQTSLANGPYHSVTELWGGELKDLTTNLSLSPYLGGQDFYQCCLKALNQSLSIDHGNPVFAQDQTFLHGTISELLSYQNPCTASYNGSNGDQPQLTISYTWCHQTCPGWQRTSTAFAGEWVQPLIAFILPTIVFCFTIPRRRRIIIPPWLFPYNGLLDFPGNLTLIYKIPAAIILLVIDAIIWALTSIVVAGPMTLSGCLERMLDSRLLEFLSSSKNNQGLTTQVRSHILLLVLIGNLDLESTWQYSSNVVRSLEQSATSPDEMPTNAVSDDKTSDLAQTDTAPKRVLTSSTIPPIREDGEDHTEKLEESKIEVTIEEHSPQIPKQQMQPEINSMLSTKQTEVSDVDLQSMKSKLSSLLESQPTFGSSVGIGVLFYTSSFVYSIMEVRDNYGDSSTSHSLAFGIFWMIVGHVAVVASVLLAGNNPSSWEAIASEPTNLTHLDTTSIQGKNRVSHRQNSVHDRFKSWIELSMQKRRISLPDSLKQYFYRTSFPSKFKSAWMWNRGLTKALWIAQMAETYPELTSLQSSVLRIGLASWFFSLILPSLALIVLPAFLGGMTSYTTPTVGLSCRSMIPLLYAWSQTMLVLLWVWDWRSWKTAKTGKFVTIQELRAQKMTSLSTSELLWYACFILCIITSIFTAFGGTVFHLMGLFQNCLCWIPIWHWPHRYSSSAMTYLSGNSAEQIYYARTYWLPLAIAATVLLLATTYIGWQYQHRLRREYSNQLDLLGREKENQSADVSKMTGLDQPHERDSHFPSSLTARMSSNTPIGSIDTRSDASSHKD